MDKLSEFDGLGGFNTVLAVFSGCIDLDQCIQERPIERFKYRIQLLGQLRAHLQRTVPSIEQTPVYCGRSRSFLSSERPLHQAANTILSSSEMDLAISWPCWIADGL